MNIYAVVSKPDSYFSYFKSFFNITVDGYCVDEHVIFFDDLFTAKVHVCKKPHSSAIVQMHYNPEEKRITQLEVLHTLQVERLYLKNRFFNGQHDWFESNLKSRGELMPALEELNRQYQVTLLNMLP